MTGSYYHRASGAGPDDVVYRPTDLTRSNWGLLQHGSPPLALLTREIEHLLAGSDQRVARLSLDILGAVPLAPVRVRPGCSGRAGGSGCWRPRCSAVTTTGRWRG